MKDGEIVSFIKDVEITNEKADTICSALSNEIENLRRFGSDVASVILGHKRVASKLKRDNRKIVAIHCDNHRLDPAILLFFKENTFLMKNNKYLIR